MSRRGDPDAGPQGLAVIDKPPGWTSHDVVARARKVLGTRRVGHAGTLDPDATGVLLLGVGRVTRLLRFVSALPKTYVTEFLFGAETTTLDASGEVTATHDMGALTTDQVVATARQLTGEILQVPPMVSAIHVGGRRLHELARAGIEVEREARPVRVDRFDLEPLPASGLLGAGGASCRWRAVVTCSSGTYVRSLVADLGSLLGGGAHLVTLVRTAVGPYELAQAVALDDLSPEVLLPPVEALRWLPLVKVDEAVAADVRHGKVLPTEVVAPPGDADGGPWRVVGPDGSLLAVYDRHGPDRAKPEVVLVGS